QDVREAAARLAGVAVRTPLRFVEPLHAYLKLESMQPMGAFKLRGAYNAISRLPQAARRQGVITYSSGNHGQAVAYAAQLLGVRASPRGSGRASLRRGAGPRSGASSPAARPSSSARSRRAARCGSTVPRAWRTV